jgi:type IV pilus assembly protein PilX
MNRSRGAVLIISVILLLALTLIGLTGMQGASIEERIAGNTRQYSLAFQAAEAGLRSGEAILGGATLPVFGTTPGFLAQPVVLTTDLASFWMTYAWDTGSQVSSGTLSGLISQPRYAIEPLPSSSPTGGSVKFAPLPGNTLFRITSRGVGGTADAQVILQTTYER